jgi:hypothetical protein
MGEAEPELAGVILAWATPSVSGALLGLASTTASRVLR